MGAGASKKSSKAFFHENKCSYLSEISFLAGFKASTKGVDSSKEDEKNDPISLAKTVANKYSCIVGVTGEVDYISDGSRLARINNGNRLLSKVTGTGCMASALVASFCGATRDHYIATLAGIATMAISGEIAFEKAGKKGTVSFRNAIIDNISNMNSKIFSERGKIDEI